MAFFLFFMLFFFFHDSILRKFRHMITKSVRKFNHGKKNHIRKAAGFFFLLFISQFNLCCLPFRYLGGGKGRVFKTKVIAQCMSYGIAYRNEYVCQVCNYLDLISLI